MANYLFYLNPKRVELMKEAEKIPEYGRKSMAEIFEMALQEFILKHGNSNNPQTKISIYQSELIKAIPTIYAERKDFEKFYNLLNKEEYQELDEKLNMILEIHNGFLH